MLADTGGRPAIKTDQGSPWPCLFGAFCPDRNVQAELGLLKANAEAVSLHRAKICLHVENDAHAVHRLGVSGCIRTVTR